jgi:hypothetical protein
MFSRIIRDKKMIYPFLNTFFSGAHLRLIFNFSHLNRERFSTFYVCAVETQTSSLQSKPEIFKLSVGKLEKNQRIFTRAARNAPKNGLKSENVGKLRGLRPCGRSLRDFRFEWKRERKSEKEKTRNYADKHEFYSIYSVFIRLIPQVLRRFIRARNYRRNYLWRYVILPFVRS